MKVEQASDLAYQTYYMVRWESEPQMPSRQRCSDCGREMSSIEALVGNQLVGYEGLVCHRCKRVTWVRKG